MKMRLSKLLIIPALILASCMATPSPDSSRLALSGASPLPDLEIVFKEAEDRLGFMDSNGSGYVSYPVDLSGWYHAPGVGPTLIDYVTWDPGGSFLVSGYTGYHRGSGWPLLLTQAGEAYGCAPEISPYAPSRFWSIGGGHLLAVDRTTPTYKVVVFDIDNCRIVETLYTASADANQEGVGEAALSSEGWLVISRGFLMDGESKADLLILDGDGVTVASIPDGVFPAWSRNGEWLAFYIWDDGLHIARKDGSDSRRVVGGLERRVLPSWSPDGKWLVYHQTETDSNGRGIPVIYKVSVATGEQVELHRGGYFPNWRW